MNGSRMTCVHLRSPDSCPQNLIKCGGDVAYYGAFVLLISMVGFRGAEEGHGSNLCFSGCFRCLEEASLVSISPALDGRTRWACGEKGLSRAAQVDAEAKYL